MFRLNLTKFFKELSANQKMEYFFDAVYNNERLYVFSEQDDLVLRENSEGVIFLPVYPSYTTADYARQLASCKETIEEVFLDEFCESIITELEKDAAQLGVFYDGRKGILISTEDFMEAMGV